MTKNVMYEVDVLIAEGYWKRAIVYLLNVGSFMFIGYNEEDELFELFEFIDFTGDKKPDDGMDLLEFVRYFQNNEVKYMPGDELKIYLAAREMKVHIERLGLLNGLSKDDEMELVSLNAKGLEIALKLQEHDDNERRFNDQRTISNTLKTNSTRSFWVSILALVMAFISVYFSYNRMEHSERRLELLENKTAHQSAVIEQPVIKKTVVKSTE